jgi:hypothetical protein
MIGRGFKSVVWVATIGIAALVCYMFSLRVAEERAGLAELEGQIRQAEQSIQTLKTELGTRSRVHQLQHWAAADFGFASPTAGQFLRDEVTLASLDMPAAAPALESPVQVAAAPIAAPEQRKPVQAVAPVPAPSRPALRQASTQPAADRTLLRRASVVEASAAPAAAARAKPAKPAAARPPATRPALVKDRTLQAIDRSARAERGADHSAGRPR